MQRDPENPERRVLIGGCVAAAAGLYYRAARAADDDDEARNAKPQKGDQLVYLGGDHDGEVIAPADLKEGGPSALAWPYDPEKKVPRDGSRLNVVLLVRLNPKDIAEDEAKYSADGIVAFSGTCTHQQCPVAEWLDERQIFQCPCHQSQFDPKEGAKVVGGPAPRPLPKIPVAVADGKLLIAGPFIGRVGGMQPGTG
jgi:rieske iron-sulfur protein